MLKESPVLPQPDVSHVMLKLAEISSRLDKLEAPAISTPERVFSFLVKEFNIPICVIMSMDRRKEVVLARHFGYWLLCNCEGYTTTRTGSLFGREHSTVIAGLQAMVDVFYHERTNDQVPKRCTELLVKWQEYAKSE